MFLGIITMLLVIIFVPLGIGYIVLVLAKKETDEASKKIGLAIGWIIIIGSLALLIAQLVARP